MNAFGVGHHDRDAAGRCREGREAERGAVGVERIALGGLVVVVHEAGGDEAGRLTGIGVGGGGELGETFSVGDGDGDKTAEVYFGDGWHFDYGKVARGRLSVAHKTRSGWQTELIDDTPGQYEIARIALEDVDGEDGPELIAAGNKYINLYKKGKHGWSWRRLADGSSFALAQLEAGWHLVVPGTPIQLIPLKAGRGTEQPVIPTGAAGSSPTGASGALPGKPATPSHSP